MDNSNPDTINKLSYVYIDFFKAHPTYFVFIYSDKTSCKIIFPLNELEDNYPPFEIFRKV